MKTDSQFHVLRACVERELRDPSVVMVTSAKAGDGKTLTASGLAHCLAQSGHRVALVDATAGAASGLRRSLLVPDDADVPVTLSLPKPGTGRIRETISAFVATTRETYDYTILDCGSLLGDQAALTSAGLVDGVIVSVCVGRPPVRDDKAMMTMLGHSAARLLGIVAVSAEAIAHHRRSLIALPDLKREPATAALATSTAGNRA